MTDRATTVVVDYSFQDGYHVFTSKDVYGLLVASKEISKAITDLAPTIETLVRLNHGISVRADMTEEFGEFLLRSRGGASPRDAASSRTFVLSHKAA